MLRLGEHLVVRLPVRAEAAPLVEHEARWLAEASAPLDVETPVPVFVGRPTDGYPWSWLVCPWIEGTMLADVPVADRDDVVDGLADALVALHRPAPPDAPANPFRGVPLATRADVVAERIRRWHGPADALARAWEAALAAPAWPGPPYWLHGDPHPLNLLVEGGRLVGMLDFGDLTAGDPASDLAAAWWCFDAAQRARFRARLDAFGRYDEHVWTRAAGWAASLASAAEPGSSIEAIALHTAAGLSTGG